MGIDQRNSRFNSTLRQHSLALGLFSAMKWRCIDDQQHLRASGDRRFGGRRVPGVFADQQTQLQTFMLKHTGLPTGAEVALLIKHAKIGQQLLGIAD